MTRSFTYILLLMVQVSIAQVYYPATETDFITITYRDLTLKKKNKVIEGRLQFRPLNEGAILYANNFGKLPSFFKKFTIKSGTNLFAFTANDLLLTGKPLSDSMVKSIQQDTIFFSDMVRKEKLLSTYSLDSKRFYSGDIGGRFFRYNWAPLALIPAIDPSKSITLDISGTLFKKAGYKTIQLPVGYAPRLPALDTATCIPYNRFHELRKMRGYGIDNFRYTTYTMPARETVRKQFELYFEKNSSSVNPDQLLALKEYLKQNNYSILNATIEGYTSPEGNESNNAALQQKRAFLLLQQLQKYNNEPIHSEKTILNQGYDLFRQSIRGTSYAWLDTLNNEALLNKLNADKLLVDELEPYLTLQRKSVLKLVVAKRLEGNEIIERFKKDFTNLERQLLPGVHKDYPLAELEARVMGMIEWLFDLLENDGIPSEEVAEIIDTAHANSLVRIMSVYHNIILFEKRDKLPEDSLQWQNLSERYNYNELFMIAQSNLISLIRHPSYYKQRDKLKRQLVDIQTYSFDYLLNGWLSVDALCNLDFPDTPGFRSYKLNQLSFLQMLSRTMNVPCEMLKISKDVKLKQSYTDTWLDEQSTDNTDSMAILATKTPQGRYIPTYGREVYSPLLFYLKKLFVNKESSIRQHVITSDNQYEFDIYTLIEYNVRYWEPEVNYFEDYQIQLLEMDMLIKLLKRSDRRICAKDVNQLYLDYHLKALHYLSANFEPGNSDHNRIGQQSLQFITNYYSRKASQITPRLSVYIVKQLNAFHWIPGNYDATWYAWNLLKSIATVRPLTEQEHNLYTKYHTTFNPVDSKL
jgi:hypothetical protein